MGSSLLDELCGEAANRNVLISPLSVAVAAAIAALGASQGSQTESELRAFLRHNDVDEAAAVKGLALLSEITTYDEKVELHVASSIWVKDKILPSYVSAAAKLSAEGHKLSTAKAINLWVGKATKGTISEIVEELSNDSIAVIVNAIYFKGRWQSQFDPKNTRSSVPFKLFNGKTVPCKMMQQELRNARYGERDGIQVLDVPYGQGHHVARLYLPDKGQQAMSRCIKRIKEDDAWRDVDKVMDTVDSVALLLPRFKVEFVSDLSSAMKALDVKRPFDRDAEFGRLTKASGACIGRVLHKTFLEVDEEGSVAAAVTAIDEYGDAERFCCDRPFVFSIVDTRSGVTLFVGRIAEPKFDKEDGPLSTSDRSESESRRRTGAERGGMNLAKRASAKSARAAKESASASCSGSGSASDEGESGSGSGSASVPATASGSASASGS